LDFGIPTFGPEIDEESQAQKLQQEVENSSSLNGSVVGGGLLPDGQLIQGQTDMMNTVVEPIPMDFSDLLLLSPEDLTIQGEKCLQLLVSAALQLFRTLKDLQNSLSSTDVLASKQLRLRKQNYLFHAKQLKEITKKLTEHLKANQSNDSMEVECNEELLKKRDSLVKVVTHKNQQLKLLMEKFLQLQLSINAMLTVGSPTQ